MNINIFHFSDLSSTAFILPMQTIDVWFFKTEDFPPDAQDTQILSTEERNRIAGYSQVKDRIQHQTARFLLRLLLGKYLHIAPEELVLRTGTHGKLYLDYDALTVRGLGHLPRLSFNLSHSEEQIAFAFSFSSPVGIDIEKIRENARSSHLVHRFFHPDEELRFAHLPEWESTQLFFRYWTIREAFLKGIGTGFTISADSFRIDEIDSDSGLYQLTKYPLWRVQALPAPDKYFCSVAYCVQNPL